MQTVFRPLVIQFDDTFAYENSFRNQYFSVNQSGFRERKERIVIYRLEEVTDVFAQNTAQPGKRDIFMKNRNEGRDVLGDSRKRYRCLWEEIGKYGLR